MTVRKIGDTYLDRYTVAKVLSSKGMSHVYAMVDTRLNKLVCLKEVSKGTSRDDVNYASLQNEVDVLSSLSHYGLPVMIDVHEGEGTLSLLMTLMSGESFADLLKKNGKGFDPKWLVPKMIQLCLILGYLHSRTPPIFYRDLKPANIILQDNDVKLLDFGISVKLDSDHQVIEQPLGTAGYAPPEQAKVGTPYDLRSDIYSFGVTLFELLTGVRPIDAKGNFDISRYGVSSPALQRVVKKCTRLNPDERYRSFDEVLTALKIYEMCDAGFHKRYQKQLSLIKTLWIFGIATLMLSGLSGVGYSLVVDSEYSSQVAQVDKLPSPEGYARVIQQYPTEIDPYFKLVDTLRVGNEFTPEEESILLGAVRPNLTNLSNNPQYPKLALEIGKLYWFFYKGKTADSRVLALPWLKDTGAEGESLYKMSVFQRDINSLRETASDSGYYKDAWNNLVRIVNDTPDGILKLQSELYLVGFVNSYCPQMKADGITKEGILTVLKGIHTVSDSSNKIQELSRELSAGLFTALNTVEVTYNVN